MTVIEVNFWTLPFLPRTACWKSQNSWACSLLFHRDCPSTSWEALKLDEEWRMMEPHSASFMVKRGKRADTEYSHYSVFSSSYFLVLRNAILLSYQF